VAHIGTAPLTEHLRYYASILAQSSGGSIAPGAIGCNDGRLATREWQPLRS